MNETRHYIELIEQARAGNRESMDRLADGTRDRLYSYVYRSTLHHQIAEDIVQESLLEMVKLLGKLEKADGFWPWLCAIAYNKIRNHRRREKMRSTVPLSKIPDVCVTAEGKNPSHEGLANVMSRELKEIILESMGNLKPRYRDILAMRCYENMEYAQIATVMECSEFNSRVLFHRAKKALAKQLSRRGLSKGALLSTLIMFGKLTAPSEAAAANIVITSATVKVGAAAAVTAIATSKVAVVTLAAAGVITAGSVIPMPSRSQIDVGPQRSQAHSIINAPPQPRGSSQKGETWYYYPPRGNGAVIIRSQSVARGSEAYCQRLQNEQANFY